MPTNFGCQSLYTDGNYDSLLSPDITIEQQKCKCTVSSIYNMETRRMIVILRGYEQ